MLEEEYYEKTITPFYTTVPAQNEIEFKVQHYRSMNFDYVSCFISSTKIKNWK